MKKALIISAMLVAGTASASELTVKYDCDYSFDNHEHTAQVEYNVVTQALKVAGDIHGQDVRSVLNYKSRYQLFKDTAIIRDRFSGKLLTNSKQIKNLKCEIYGA